MQKQPFNYILYLVFPSENIIKAKFVEINFCIKEAKI